MVQSPATDGPSTNERQRMIGRRFMTALSGQRLRNAIRPLIGAAALSLSLSLTGCVAQVSNHGHVFTQEEIAQIRKGMSKEQVKLILGTPDTQSSLGGDAYYYISSRHETVGFMPPKVTDRKILAIYFDEYNTTRRVAHYGLKDGKIVDIMSGTTPSHGQELNFLQQMFSNLGKRVAM